MKPSKTKLGHKIQQYLLERRYPVEQLAAEMGITGDGLSNLIHGRRRFKDETLKKLAATPIFKEGNFTLSRLKAYRAIDEYSLEEIVLALAVCVRQGELADLDACFFDNLHQELERENFPLSLADKKNALVALIQQDQS